MDKIRVRITLMGRARDPLRGLERVMGGTVKAVAGLRDLVGAASG